ncbi:CHAP domain-containing protein [Pseudomonas sp. P9_31]|uniref:CHAP domain-containing protein n=1 Tax=Pseudomonas sp. P9_31 TaxID=3043448 RepID=UPI002A35924D|nr:CHAP domain-containing protein [Pseudomonas sp. P9_31]WPN56046.1 CHAP domain-containing protein [Pseudomonas sp. P9_31]
MSWSTDAATQHIRTHAGTFSHNRCAEFTRQAIAAGGVVLTRTHNAKDYGVPLEHAGFRVVPIGSSLRAGDVAIIQPYTGGNPSGHMTMFDGTAWYSDFKQSSMYPGPGYREAHPSYKIYRKN